MNNIDEQTIASPFTWASTVELLDGDIPSTMHKNEVVFDRFKNVSDAAPLKERVCQP